MQVPNPNVPVAAGETIMETKNVIINEMSLNLPSYYQQVESLPDGQRIRMIPYTCRVHS